MQYSLEYKTIPRRMAGSLAGSKDSIPFLEYIKAVVGTETRQSQRNFARMLIRG